MEGMKRQHKLLIWSAGFVAFGVVNASIYGNTDSGLNAALALASVVPALGFLGWSENVRHKKEQHR